MFTSHKQISPPSLVLKLKISEVSQKWIPKAVELKRIPTHKKCKCKKFCSQTRLVGEIYSSDVIMHRGYCINTFTTEGIFLHLISFPQFLHDLFHIHLSHCLLLSNVFGVQASIYWYKTNGHIWGRCTSCTAIRPGFKIVSMHLTACMYLQALLDQCLLKTGFTQ